MLDESHVSATLAQLDDRLDALERDVRIAAAEQEAAAVVAEAKLRIAEIGARTRAQLERAAAGATGAGRPFLRTRRDPEPRTYEGDVWLEAGRFVDIESLHELQTTLESIPTVVDVYVDAFAHQLAHFRLHVTEPTPLITELQRRARQPLYVVEAGAGRIRLEVVKDE